MKILHLLQAWIALMFHTQLLKEMCASHRGVPETLIRQRYYIDKMDRLLR